MRTAGSTREYSSRLWVFSKRCDWAIFNHYVRNYVMHLEETKSCLNQILPHGTLLLSKMQEKCVTENAYNGCSERGPYSQMSSTGTAQSVSNGLILDKDQITLFGKSTSKVDGESLTQLLPWLWPAMWSRMCFLHVKQHRSRLWTIRGSLRSQDADRHLAMAPSLFFSHE